MTQLPPTAAAALSDAQVRLDAALAAGSIGTWIWDVRRNWVVGDRNLVRMFSVPPENAGGAPIEIFLQAVHPDDAGAVREMIQAVLESEHGQFEMDYRVRQPDGSARWIVARGSVQRDAEGRPSLFPGVAIDITDRKHAEHALRETAERLKLALSASELGDWSWDAHTDVMTLSPRALEIYGLPPGTRMKREEIRQLLLPEDADLTREVLEDSLRQRSDYELEYRIQWPTGERRWVAARGRGIYAADGSIQSMIGVVQDVTASRRAAGERELLLQSERAARTEAERLGRMKDEFLATLSHELRTPLNAILGWAALLRRVEPGSPDHLRGLETIERNARVQAQIIGDLLDMSRIISGKVQLDVQRVDVREVITAAMDSVRPSAEAKRLTVRTVLGEVGEVRGDPARLQQIFWNLLSNAVKFTAPGGRISIALERVESHVEVAIEDNGIGIKPEFLAYVFDRFRQADATITRRHGGLGIGLSIVKHLTELHGGHVRVQSGGEGQGTTFTVSLPVSALTSDAVTEEQRRHFAEQPGYHFELPGLNGVQALVVDDEADARLLIQRLLEERGASVVTAPDAAMALKILATTAIDILVSDIGMPGMDGYQLIEQVRARARGTLPAIALTAYARAEDRQRALLAGYHMHLSKPVEPVDLIAGIATLLGLHGGKRA